MPEVFEYHHTVSPDEIDPLGHASNVAYVQWLQSAALAHSAAQGWPGERYREFGTGWVVRSHTIEYLRPAVAGDQVVVRTWVTTMKKASSLRRYQVLRTPGEQLLATAQTRWACVDFRTGQAVRIPPEIAQSFQPVDLGPAEGDAQGERGRESLSADGFSKGQARWPKKTVHPTKA